KGRQCTRWRHAWAYLYTLATTWGRSRQGAVPRCGEIPDDPHGTDVRLDARRHGAARSAVPSADGRDRQRRAAVDSRPGRARLATDLLARFSRPARVRPAAARPGDRADAVRATLAPAPA